MSLRQKRPRIPEKYVPGRGCKECLLFVLRDTNLQGRDPRAPHWQGWRATHLSSFLLFHRSGFYTRYFGQRYVLSWRHPPPSAERRMSGAPSTGGRIAQASAWPGGAQVPSTWAQPPRTRFPRCPAVGKRDPALANPGLPNTTSWARPACKQRAVSLLCAEARAVGLLPCVPVPSIFSKRNRLHRAAEHPATSTSGSVLESRGLDRTRVQRVTDVHYPSHTYDGSRDTRKLWSRTVLTPSNLPHRGATTVVPRGLVRREAFRGCQCPGGASQGACMAFSVTQHTVLLQPGS